MTQRGDVSNPKLARKRDQTCISCTNGDTNLQMCLLLRSFPLNNNPLSTFTSRHFGHFWYKAFTRSVLLLKLLKNCLQENISSESPYRSGFDISTTNCIWYISLVSFCDYFNPSITFRTIYANLGFFWPNVSNNDVRTRIRISKFVKPLLRNQYICLKVFIISYFDLFITICTWCTNKNLSWPNLGLITSQSESKGWGEASGFCNVQKMN